MQPTDALHMKVMFADALQTPEMHRYLAGWANGNPSSRYMFPSHRVGNQWVTDSGESIARGLLSDLRMTETYYLSSDIFDVIEHVGEFMPPEVMHMEDVPSTHGWLLFEKPWIMQDINGFNLPIRVIMWCQEMVGKEEVPQLGQHMGLVVWALSDFADYKIDDSIMNNPEYPNIPQQIQRMKSLEAKGVRLLPNQIYAAAYNTYSLERADRKGMILSQITDSQFTTLDDNGDGTWKFKMDGVKATRTVDVRPEPLTAFLQCLWRFQKQEIAAFERPHLRKSMSRWLMNRNLMPKPVSVIKLRRRAPGPETGTSYTLSHRFVVRGHWRRQWYASEQRHKSIYIQPFLKGPEGAPLLSRERVNAIVR